MNFKASLLCLSFCFASVISMSIVDSTNKQWEDHKEKIHKTYTPENESILKANSKRNLKKFNLNNERLENKGEVSYKMDTNSFTDKDPADNNKMKSEYEPEVFKDSISEYYPNITFDWSKERELSPVMNRENCDRADWAFAAVGMLEGYLYRKRHVTIWLSAQDLLDCDINQGNSGCSGGNVRYAFDYIQQCGISNQSSYPFKGSGGECKNTRSIGIPKGWTIETDYINYNDENYMREKIYNVSPIAAQIKMSYWKQFLEKYNGQIFSKCNITDAVDDDNDEPYNVLIVGYGEDNAKKYWIVKNWMGEGWGENGYAKIASDSNNNCGGLFNNVTVIKKVTGKLLF